MHALVSCRRKKIFLMIYKHSQKESLKWAISFTVKWMLFIPHQSKFLIDNFLALGSLVPISRQAPGQSCLPGLQEKYRNPVKFDLQINNRFFFFDFLPIILCFMCYLAVAESPLWLPPSSDWPSHDVSSFQVTLVPESFVPLASGWHWCPHH